MLGNFGLTAQKICVYRRCKQNISFARCSIILELSKWLKLLIRNLLYKFYNSSIADIHCTLFFIHIYSDILFTQVSHFNRRSF